MLPTARSGSAVVEARCPRRPPDLSRQVEALLLAAAGPGDEVVRRADGLGESLDRLLEGEGLLPHHVPVP